jgi:hypothetical protein
MTRQAGARHARAKRQAAFARERRSDRKRSSLPREKQPFTKEISMTIGWRHDVDAVLAQAKREGKPVLLDFSAAPM